MESIFKTTILISESIFVYYGYIWKPQKRKKNLNSIKKCFQIVILYLVIAIPNWFPCVKQYWAIVNASLSCNTFARFLVWNLLFQAYINGAKDWLSTVMLVQKGEQSSREWEITGSLPYGTLFYAPGQNLTIVKSDWTQVWLFKKVTRVSIGFSDDE